jgi:heat shock protein HtpX
MKRLFLFLLTNLSVIFVLSISLRLLGVERILDEQGIGLDLNALLVFAGMFGFGGALISLAISKWTAMMRRMSTRSPPA